MSDEGAPSAVPEQVGESFCQWCGGLRIGDLRLHCTWCGRDGEGQGFYDAHRRFCGVCGCETAPGDRFCRGCGSLLLQAATHVDDASASKPVAEIPTIPNPARYNDARTSGGTRGLERRSESDWGRLSHWFGILLGRTATVGIDPPTSAAVDHNGDPKRSPAYCVRCGSALRRVGHDLANFCDACGLGVDGGDLKLPWALRRRLAIALFAATGWGALVGLAAFMAVQGIARRDTPVSPVRATTAAPTASAVRPSPAPTTTVAPPTRVPSTPARPAPSPTPEPDENHQNVEDGGHQS